MNWLYPACLSLFLFFDLFFSIPIYCQVLVGADFILSEDYLPLLKHKNVGLITNHTAINHKMQLTSDLIKAYAVKYDYNLVALFAPEHGIHGDLYSTKLADHEKDPDGVPIYSLHSHIRRPTSEMLQDIDVLIYDIQDIGVRSYTYITTLFYVMEEAAKHQIDVIVLDRPNPINGLIVDGPMMEEKWRSFVGYLNVPYCHGMTIGELAHFFNEEYRIECRLHVVPMKGWKRWMNFQETGLSWIPTSPNIAEATTPLYCPITGILGELQIVNIGIGYTLPFKLIGAPWIDAKVFSEHLNKQKFPGVFFKPFYYKPFYGRFAQEDCQGVLILITNQKIYRPVATQFLIIGILKSLYPVKFKEAIEESISRKEMFCKVIGKEEIYKIITEEKNIVWKLKEFDQKARDRFLQLRKKYLISSYSTD